jgi:hypothetical protein
MMSHDLHLPQWQQFPHSPIANKHAGPSLINLNKKNCVTVKGTVTVYNFTEYLERFYYKRKQELSVGLHAQLFSVLDIKIFLSKARKMSL